MLEGFVSIDRSPFPVPRPWKLWGGKKMHNWMGPNENGGICLDKAFIGFCVFFGFFFVSFFFSFHFYLVYNGGG